MATNDQLRLIHTAARQVRLNDEQYRTLLRGVAGVDSSKQLDNVGVEDVMAVMEDLGFRDRFNPDPDFWRNKIRRRGWACSERMAFKIERMAEECRYELPALCMRFSDHRTDQVRQLRPREAWNLIEMLKAVEQREGPTVNVDATEGIHACDPPN